MSQMAIERLMAAFTLLMVIFGLATVGWVLASVARGIMRYLRTRRTPPVVKENPMFSRDYEDKGGAWNDSEKLPPDLKRTMILFWAIVAALVLLTWYGLK